MKGLKLYILAIILIFSVQSYSQKADTIPYKESFVIIHYSDDDQVRFYEHSFFMKKDSSWKRTFYSKGKIINRKVRGIEMIDTVYTDNKFLEINENYYVNGNLKSTWFNKPPKKDRGLIRIWSMDSIYLSFYSNGQILDSLFYVHNELVGNSKHYYQNGQIAYEVEYKDGELYKVVEYFDKKGNKLNAGTFKNGTGSWIKYDNNGNESKIEIYKNGKLKKVKKQSN